MIFFVVVLGNLYVFTFTRDTFWLYLSMIVLFTVILLAEFIYFRHQYNSGQFRRYSAPSAKGSLLLNGIFLLIGIAIVALFLSRGSFFEAPWIWGFILFVLGILGFHFYVGYNYGGYIYASEHYVFDYPMGAFFMCTKNLHIREDPKTGNLIIEEKGPFLYIRTRAGLYISKEEKQRFLSENKDVFLKHHLKIKGDLSVYENIANS